MTGAMYAAVAGLKTHMSALNVVGNNVANVNTHAYKAASYTFAEEIYTTSKGGSDGTNVTGGTNPAQIGFGCSMGSIDVDMTSKNFAATGQPLDVCIDGEGFLMVGDKGLVFRDLDEVSQLNLTRHGRLKFDAQGYLTDMSGNVVYGWINVKKENTATDDPNADPNDLAAQSEPCPALTGIRLPMMDQYGNVYLPRVVDGQLVDASNENIAAENGDTLPDGVNAEDLKLQRVVLDSISVDKNGSITGTTKGTGQVVTVGYIAIGQVDNPNGVTHIDGRYYKAMDGAGRLSVTALKEAVKNSDAFNGADGANDQDRVDGEVQIINGGKTELMGGGLESSGTDLAMEITNMILMQRGYQANTRIITVTDSMLEELVNMKRG